MGKVLDRKNEINIYKKNMISFIVFSLWKKKTKYTKTFIHENPNLPNMAIIKLQLKYEIIF